MFSHLADEGLIAGFFVCGSPQHHFCESRRQVDSFGREVVNQLTSVRRIILGVYNSVGHQLAETIRQNVRRDAFVTLQEFFVAARRT